MRLRTLTLENYRGFVEHTFEFSDTFNVIAGINGRGKTAILDAIGVVCSRLLPQISDAKKQYCKVGKYDVHHEAESFQVTASFNCAGMPVQFDARYVMGQHKLRFPTLARQVVQAIQTRYGNPDLPDDASPIVVSYTTDRGAYRIPKALGRSAPPIREAAYRGALVNRTVDYRDLAHRLRLAESPDAYSDYPGLGQRMRDAFRRVIGVFLSGLQNLRVTDDPFGLFINKQETPLAVHQLSDGERAFLAMCADLARRLSLANPGLPNPLTGAGIVLIDELELHLHPSWQRTAVENLRTTFPHIQFIATTHSPFIIQSLRSGELIQLDEEITADYADKSIEDISENVMGVEMPQKSERYLDMMKAAEEYFRVLRQVEGQPDSDQVRAAKQRLDELSAPFSDDPAYQAFLRVERESTLGGNNDAAH